MSSRRLGLRLSQIPDTPMIGLTWGPISVLFDRQFKRVAANWKAQASQPQTLIIAGTYAEFVDWCRARDIHPHSKEVVFVGPGGLHTLRGRGAVQALYIGSWRSRRDLAEIENQLKALNVVSTIRSAA